LTSNNRKLDENLNFPYSFLPSLSTPQTAPPTLLPLLLKPSLSLSSSSSLLFLSIFL
jgi:hypothetical protein